MLEAEGMVKAGSRFDLRTGHGPDAPETEGFEGPQETHGWVHSYETGSTVDGPGVRVAVADGDGLGEADALGDGEGAADRVGDGDGFWPAPSPPRMSQPLLATFQFDAR